MLLIASALIVAAAVLVAAQRIAVAVGRTAGDRDDVQPIDLLRLFAPGLAAVDRDPRALLVWQPLAQTARRLYPDAFGTLDRASGASFPFTAEQIDAAHARWTADWLAWELAHDTEYKLKAAALERDVAAGAPGVRDRLEAVEREKLETYQQRYQEYVRVAKALQALMRA